MVNEKQEIKTRTVKVEQARSGDPEATAKGGLAAMQALANWPGLWNIIKTHVPSRKDPTQGFTTEAAICALAHGLLAGGQGFSATEAMRGDAPLLKMLGLERAPSAETVEEVLLTNLEPPDARVQALMKKLNLPFEETIFHLYAHKQAMENQWKDLLSGLGVHHPPCAHAAVNSVFLCVAALACNVATAFRQLCLKGKDRAMQLWRLRLEVIDIPAVVAHTGRVVTARLLDARDRIVERVILAMLRLSRL